MGGIGQTRFPVRADRPEVAHLAPVTGVGVDRVGLGGNSDPTLRLCLIGDSAPSVSIVPDTLEEVGVYLLSKVLGTVLVRATQAQEGAPCGWSMSSYSGGQTQGRTECIYLRTGTEPGGLASQEGRHVRGQVFVSP